jgi:hypothetical protein
MSKKKNTLKDLDEFLKQQAATLVSPEKLSDKIDTPRVPEAKQEPAEELPVIEQKQEISHTQILSHLKLLTNQEGPRFRARFYDLIIQTMEFQNQYSPEDRMLINTVLYLKNGERWKEAIQEYWKAKK